MGQCLAKETNEDRLLRACAEGHYHQVVALLRQHVVIDNIHSIDVNCRDEKDGDTPLHKACHHAMLFDAGNECGEDDLHLVEFLLQHGADVNATDRGGLTPLHWACVYHDVELVKLLVQHGANIHARDPLAQTPLHKAHDCVAIVEFLVQTAAKVSLVNANNLVKATDCFGKTLHNRLLQDLQEELPSREFSNRADGHARHTQEALSFLDNYERKLKMAKPDLERQSARLGDSFLINHNSSLDDDKERQAFENGWASKTLTPVTEGCPSPESAPEH